MKVLMLILLLLQSVLVCAQNKANVFTGTWQYQNGTEVFIVKIWEENNRMYGYYKKITVDTNGNQTSVVYTSRTDYGNGDYLFPYVIYGEIGPNGFEALFKDNTMTNINENYKRGKLHMEITQFGATGPPGCSECMKALWQVTDTGGMYVNFVEGFSVPVNVIMTKVSNQVVFD